MKLVTPVEITHAKLQIGYDTPVLLLGSCFTDEIGKRLQEAGFDVLCNPFGTLYNPLSITSCLERAMSGRGMQEEDMVQHEGVWHSWLHHSRFSHPDRETCMAHCNEAIAQTHEFLQRSPLLMVTFGTAWVFYRQGRVVANSRNVVSDTDPSSSIRGYLMCQKWPACSSYCTSASEIEVLHTGHQLMILLPL